MVLFMNDVKTTISKKEYFGQMDLYEIEIPDGVTEIGDWAFADCSNLQMLLFPMSVQRIGRQIVEGCDKLQMIVVRGLKCGEEMKYLLTHVFRELDFPISESISEVGTTVWMEQMDVRILSFLQSDDAEGFTPFLAGGEEDYADVQETREAYCIRRRMRKLVFVSERLLLRELFPVQEVSMFAFMQYLESCCMNTDVLLGALAFVKKRRLTFLELYGALGVLTKEICRHILERSMEHKEQQDAELYTWLLNYMNTLAGDSPAIWDDWKL